MIVAIDRPDLDIDVPESIPLTELAAVVQPKADARRRRLRGRRSGTVAANACASCGAALQKKPRKAARKGR